MNDLDLAWLRFALFLRFHIDSPGYLVDDEWKRIEAMHEERVIVEYNILCSIYPTIDVVYQDLIFPEIENL